MRSSSESASIEMRRQRKIERIHALGPRALSELIAELRRGRDIDCVLERYSSVSPEAVKVAGAERFPSQIWLVA